MFRLVTSFTDKPAFLMLCDNIECAQSIGAGAALSELTPVSLPQQEVAFLEEARRQGWFLSMRIQLCPGHCKQLQDAAETRRRAQGKGGMMVVAE